MPRCLMAKKWKSVPYEKGKHVRRNLLMTPTVVPSTLTTATTATGHHRLTSNGVSRIHSKSSILIQVQTNNEATVSNNTTTAGTSSSSTKLYATHLSNINISDNSSVLSPSGTKPMPSTTANHHHWDPSSPTEGATAPSPPPSWLPAPTAGKATVLFNGYVQASPSRNGSSSPILNHEEPEVTNMDSKSVSLIRYTPHHLKYNHLPPPKKRELYRPYCLPEPIAAVQQEKMRLHSVCSTLFERKPEDLTTARAILDLSTSSPFLPRRPLPPTTSASPPATAPIVTITRQISSSDEPITNPTENGWTNEIKTTINGHAQQQGPTQDSGTQDLPTIVTVAQQPLSALNTNTRSVTASTDSEDSSPSDIISGSPGGKTISYTYEAFFISDGRSKKKSTLEVASIGTSTPKENVAAELKFTVESDSDSCSASSSKTRYTCSECGKHYATSSNLSRHKQTHRSLDSQSAKRCPTCGKAYVSMPALAMHILTHNLHHSCEVCGKAFSRPWLLQGHLRSHTGEKPYGCAHCGKAFADRSNLRAHMQTHSSAKNYTCSRCKKSFALKSYLNKHYDSACFKEGMECPSPLDGDSSELSCDQMNGLDEEEEMDEDETPEGSIDTETEESMNVTVLVTS